jgi:hypothetical protein
MEADQYCRDLEAHLCRRNGGHLVRIVGPSFEAVQRWFQQGIPFKVACLGIDRRVDRAVAKGPTRRPMRIEFCEADVLDAFDEWRRAVGLRRDEIVPDGADVPAETPVDDGAHGHGRAPSLPTHLERVMARLTGLRAGPQVAPALSEALDSAVRRIDRLLAPARKARGEARDGLLGELAQIDADLLAAAEQATPPDLRAQVAADAAAELGPFKGRLAPVELAAATERCRLRALRTCLNLPTLTLD